MKFIEWPDCTLEDVIEKTVDPFTDFDWTVNAPGAVDKEIDLKTEFTSPFPVRCPLSYFAAVRGLTTGFYNSGDYTSYNVAHPEIFPITEFTA